MQGRVQNAVLGCNLKNDRMISVCFQGKSFNIMVIQAYAPTSNTEEVEIEQFYEDLQDLLELTPLKRCPFHYTGLEYKSRKSRNTWGNWQMWSWCTKRSRSKANRVILQYFGQLMQGSDSLEKTLMLEMIEGGRRRGQHRMRWMASPTQQTWVSVTSGSWWRTGKPGMLQPMGSQRVIYNWATELNISGMRAIWC